MSARIKQKVGLTRTSVAVAVAVAGWDPELEKRRDWLQKNETEAAHAAFFQQLFNLRVALSSFCFLFFPLCSAEYPVCASFRCWCCSALPGCLMKSHRQLQGRHASNEKKRVNEIRREWWEWKKREKSKKTKKKECKKCDQKSANTGTLNQKPM